MAIIQDENNNIKFNNVGKGGLRMGNKISRSSNGDFSDFEPGGDMEGQNPDPFVNAVEIDWNGAEVEECLLIQVGESRCSMIVPSIAA